MSYFFLLFAEPASVLRGGVRLHRPGPPRPLRGPDPLPRRRLPLPHHRRRLPHEALPDGHVRRLQVRQEAALHHLAQPQLHGAAVGVRAGAADGGEEEAIVARGREGEEGRDDDVGGRGRGRRGPLRGDEGGGGEPNGRGELPPRRRRLRLLFLLHRQQQQRQRRRDGLDAAAGIRAAAVGRRGGHLCISVVGSEARRRTRPTATTTASVHRMRRLKEEQNQLSL